MWYFLQLFALQRWLADGVTLAMFCILEPAAFFQYELQDAEG